MRVLLAALAALAKAIQHRLHVRLDYDLRPRRSQERSIQRVYGLMGMAWLLTLSIHGVIAAAVSTVRYCAITPPSAPQPACEHPT